MKHNQIDRLLDRLNRDYAKVHKNYERLFWIFNMGNHSVEKRFNKALKDLDSFRSDSSLLKKVELALKNASSEQNERLGYWKRFFQCYQSPKKFIPIKEKIVKFESKIHKKRTTQKEGYVDPDSKAFVKASVNKMRTMMRTHDDERVRKACFNATEKLALLCVNEYMELVKLRNQYACGLGFSDYYEYKLQTTEGMSKREVFKMFDEIYQKTKFAFKKIRKLEKRKPGLRKPWNFGYMMSGDFAKEEDPFMKFEGALLYWGKSFSAMGIDFRGGVLQLDLLDREGKTNNGFCHWPDPVQFKNGKRIPGSSDFTCNTVLGQVGSGVRNLETLFHEGGHAAHFLNTEQTDVCLNNEYPPTSAAWAETQSQFMDTICDSIEWRTRYAKDGRGQSYPFDLYERKVRRLHAISPLGLMGILFVSSFEKQIYESKDLTRAKVLSIAKTAFRKFFDYSQDSLFALNVYHIYHWDSSAYYHGYGLAQLALLQWREYFYEKYGYIVDNPDIYREMYQVWKLASAKTFKEFVVMATGKPLSADAFIRSITRSVPATLALAKKRIARLKRIPIYKKKIDLNATIKMVHGKKVICTNKKSFEDMAAKYKAWLKKIEKAQAVKK